MIDVADINCLFIVSILIAYIVLASILMRILAWNADRKVAKAERDQEFDDKFRGLYNAEMNKVMLKK